MRSEDEVKTSVVEASQSEGMKMRFSYAVIISAAAMIAMLPMGSIELRADARLAPPAMSLVPNGVHGVVVPVTKKTPLKRCITIGGEEFCLVKKTPGGGTGDGAQPQDGTTGGGGPGNAAPQGGNAAAPQGGNTDTKTETEPGERSCPPGYVVLDKPNKCGAFCEPKEGDPCDKKQTPPATPQIGYQCEADVTVVGHASYTYAPSQVANEAEARSLYDQYLKDQKYVPTGPVTCKPVEYK
jgi:hypothetical protein